MKILMLSEFYPPVIGGGAKIVQMLSEALAERGHSVTVCTTRHPGSSNHVNENGVTVMRLDGFFQRMPFLFGDPKRRYHPPTSDWLIMKQLRKIVEEDRPDVIHTHGLITYSALCLRERTEVPLVVSLHDYGYICPKRTFMKANHLCDRPFTHDCVGCAMETYGWMKSVLAYSAVRLNAKKLKIVDRFVAISDFVRGVYTKWFDSGGKEITVVHDFCRNYGKTGSCVSGKLPDDFVLFVGELSPHKGIDVLVRAYRRMGVKTKLVLIGPKTSSFSGASLNSENVTVIEDARPECVLEAYQKCKAVLVPSLWPEPFGLVAIEAMMYEKPVIASRVGALGEIVENGRTGLLVPPGDDSKLGEAIGYLLERPEIAKSMGAEGHLRFLGRFSEQVVLPKFEQVYKDVVAGCGA